MNYPNIPEIARNLRAKADCLTIPVNVIRIAHFLGIKVYGDILPDDISGILDVRAEPIILINKSQVAYRQRFSIAHELGHFQLHHLMGIIHVDKKSYYRNEKSAGGLDEIEIMANKFAAALLMPEKELRDELDKHDDFIDTDVDIIAEMARKFEVSTTAMSFRIQNLGYSWFQ